MRILKTLLSITFLSSICFAADLPNPATLTAGQIGFNLGGEVLTPDQKAKICAETLWATLTEPLTDRDKAKIDTVFEYLDYVTNPEADGYDEHVACNSFQKLCSLMELREMTAYSAKKMLDFILKNTVHQNATALACAAHCADLINKPEEIRTVIDLLLLWFNDEGCCPTADVYPWPVCLEWGPKLVAQQNHRLEDIIQMLQKATNSVDFPDDAYEMDSCEMEYVIEGYKLIGTQYPLYTLVCIEKLLSFNLEPGHDEDHEQKAENKRLRGEAVLQLNQVLAPVA